MAFAFAFLFPAAGARAQFTDIGAPLTPVTFGSVAWGDHDNDGDLDLLLTGCTGTDDIAVVYRNEGGVFTDALAGVRLAGVSRGAGAWGDYDNDGDLDILLAGFSEWSPIAKVYRNDRGVFTDIEAGLAGVGWGSAGWADFDNDGDLDVLLTGLRRTSNGDQEATLLYRNDGGVFTEVPAGLIALAYGSAAWGDYDGDGDLDLWLSGANGGVPAGRLYANEGRGVFTEVLAGLPPLAAGGVGWGDYDHDGGLDLLLTGLDPTFAAMARVYRNEAGAFTDAQVGLPPFAWGPAAWGDHDNDGDLDLLLAGDSGTGFPVTRVYRNDGSSFTDIAAGLTGAEGGAAWGDYDGDGDLDLALTGIGAWSSRIYRNDGFVANTPPEAPTGLYASTAGNVVTLGWQPAADAQTPADGLTYNLRVGTRPRAGNVVGPMAGPYGRRSIAAMGNAQHGLTAFLTSLPPGTYYWSVQAIDTAFAGSRFAQEHAFEVGPPSLEPQAGSAPAQGAQGTVSYTGVSPKVLTRNTAIEPRVTAAAGQ